MEMTMPRATVSLTLLFVIICTVDAMNYLAFPRMGRSGYLAFPRMGRSQAKAGTAEAIDTECCGIGLKSEFAVSDDGKEELHNICTASVSVCCEGLRELADEKPNGVVYSMCVPDVSKMYPSSYNKLKRLLTK
uniref:Small cardiac-like peptide n=1 Tax=Tritonia tetraquetra TaxID=2780533 RepID=I1SKH9_9GAST|nr:small cardiac-like peptide precursor [Tritonia tetraquetra]